MKTDLRSALMAKGATDQMLTAKIFPLMQEVYADDAVDGISEARKHVISLESRVDKATRTVDETSRRAERDEASLKALIARAEEAYKQLNPTVSQLQITDRNLVDAVNTYTLILARAKEVFGDEAMTEAVIIQLLETASYGLWRSIMGPKDGNGGRSR